MDVEYVMLFNQVDSASPTARFDVATLVGDLYAQFMQNSILPNNLPPGACTERLYYLRHRYQLMFHTLMEYLQPINDPSQIPSPIVADLNADMFEMYAIEQEFDHLRSLFY